MSELQRLRDAVNSLVNTKIKLEEEIAQLRAALGYSESDSLPAIFGACDPDHNEIEAAKGEEVDVIPDL